MKLRHAYSKSERVLHPKCGKTVTEQHHAKGCNINAIIAKYQETGLISHVNRHSPTYGDVSQADFRLAMELVTDAHTEFEDLPSSVRAEYNHDVSEYLAALETEQGRLSHQNLLNPVPEVP